MNIPAEFDEIRPYTPEELPQVFDELVADPAFQAVINVIMPGVPLEALSHQLHQCKTNLEVQATIFYPLLHKIIKEHSDGFTLNASSLPDKEKNYTFISNHRDIVLDPGFLSLGLLDNQFPNTVEIAIGDNLLQASARMSRYIHFAITEKKENIWIAQREGRAKDSNDRTQESVLKMLALAGKDDAIDSLKELNIVPTSLSYEYDPCDFLKAKEMQQKRDIEGFKKTQKDDLLNMQTGIFGYKGRVYFQTAPCLNEELETLRGLPKNELFVKAAQLIDLHIHRNYRLYPGNYIACDLLEGKQTFADKYDEKEKAKFEAYLQKKLDMIDLPNKDIPFLRQCILTMYANPTINHLKALHV